jgi:hypothetical protein
MREEREKKRNITKKQSPNHEATMEVKNILLLLLFFLLFVTRWVLINYEYAFLPSFLGMLA